MSDKERGVDDQFLAIRRIFSFVVVTVGLAGVLLLAILLWRRNFDPIVGCIVVVNFPSIIGIPFCCMGATIVLTLFQQAAKEVEFEGLGFKFKGPSGEIVLWLACFALMVGSVHLLWKPMTFPVCGRLGV